MSDTEDMSKIKSQVALLGGDCMYVLLKMEDDQKTLKKLVAQAKVNKDIRLIEKISEAMEHDNERS